MEIIQLLTVFALIVVALRYKVSVGLTLVGAGVLTSLLFAIPFDELFEGYYQLLRSRRFISLTCILILVTALGQLLKELKSLDRLTTIVSAMPGGSKTAVALLPALVGLMPMPGGSLLSAPLVGEVLRDEKYTPEFRVASNYWFRHVIEFSWPIYPGIILTEAITGLPIGTVAILHLPMAMTKAVIGYFFYSKKIENHNGKSVSVWKSLLSIIGTIWSIPLAIMIYGIFDLNLAWAILISFIAQIIVSRPDYAQVRRAVRHGLSYKLILLIFGALSFQMILELSGAISSIPQLAIEHGFPPELIIFTVCFVAGLLTGMVAAFVAMGYTVLAGFLYLNGIDPGYIFLAYFSGYLGMIIAPTHLCLVLTNEYYNAELIRSYRSIAIPVLLMFVAGVVIYWLGWGDLFKN